MRPLRLEVQGLTSYRDHIEVDFTGLDLFAIWGPTGAGKSSLVDAMTYALFGQVPRMKGSAIKELITQGEERMRVTFEFAADEGRYRIHRATARRGSAPVQLDRFDADANEWMPVADRVTEVGAEVQKLLHMDYGAFIRSVLLPQGEFDRFLAGDRDERRKIIDGLLQLGVYSAMHQRANAMAARHSEEAESIQRRLETELAHATPEALRNAKTQLKELEAREKELQKLRETVEDAARTAEKLSDERARQREARRLLAEAENKLTAARGVLAGGEKALKGLDGRIEDIRAEVKAVAYDADLHMRLSQCLPVLRNIDGLSERQARLGKEIESANAALDKLRKEADGAANKHEQAKQAAAVKREEYEEARKTNAAALLRSGLKRGDPCPVCGQTIENLDDMDHVKIDRFKTAREAAEAAESEERKAQQALVAAEQRVAVKEQEAAGLRDQIEDLKTQVERGKTDADRLLPEPGLETGAVEERIGALASTKKELDRLQDEERKLVQERERESKAIETARTDVARLETEVETHANSADFAAKSAAQAESALQDFVRSLEWDKVAETLAAGSDPAPLIAERLRSLQADANEVSREVGAQGTRIQQIEADIEKAKELREQEKEHHGSAGLARDLTSLLRTDRFPTFIREQALRALAADGSRRLEEISAGRYDFEVDGQDFVVVDRWNGGEKRSVKTLSGGETFLASLALALALAEQLPGLTGNIVNGALESLFIDEGFSHLDNETLDQVASALEVLGQDRSRMVGVITHLPALAERMPARITIHKSQAGSTVSVE